eukprot:2166808-Alexandrium_andersonii.AAC.1
MAKERLGYTKKGEPRHSGPGPHAKSKAMKEPSKREYLTPHERNMVDPRPAVLVNEMQRVTLDQVAEGGQCPPTQPA